MTPPPSKIALVHDWITVPGGAEEVLREVLGLYPGVVHTAQYNPGRFPWLENAQVRASWVSKLPLSKRKHYLYAPVLPRLYSSMDLSEFDLVLTDSHTFAHHARKRPGALHICYYHTPARSLWAPDVDDRASGTPLHTLIARRLRRLDLQASKNPDLVLANSHTTADRIRRVYGREVAEVIYPPVDTSKWSDVGRDSEDEGYLAWGRLIRYKRFDLAIEAARAMGVKLNIVGSGPLERHLKEQAAGAPNIRFHGRLPDEELKRLMARCKGVIFPCYEDFGIVPVEAMAAGLPVLAFAQGGAGETVAEDCGVQFREQTPLALSEALKSMEMMSFNPSRLRAQAAKFDTAVFRARYRRAVDTAWQKHTSATATAAPETR